MTEVIGCSHCGIFSTGVAKPDNKKEGSKTTKLPKIACCWVFEIVDTNNPIPDIENKKAATPKRNGLKLSSGSP